MKIIKTLVIIACAVAWMGAGVMAGDKPAGEKKEKKACGCCEATVQAGKACKEECCTKAAADGKVCAKCHPKQKAPKAPKK